MRVQTLVIALAMGATAFAPSAQAETEQSHRVSVAYSDLDLTRSDDARIMASRIDEAARFACGGSPRFDANYRGAKAAATRRFETCRGDAIDAALADLNAPAVAHAFSQREDVQRTVARSR